jgi:hypothetical protein
MRARGVIRWTFVAALLCSNNALASDWRTVCNELLTRTLFVTDTVFPRTAFLTEPLILQVIRGLGGPQNLEVYGDNPNKTHFVKPAVIRGFHATENAALSIKTAGTPDDPYLLLIDLKGRDADGSQLQFLFQGGVTRLLRFEQGAAALSLLVENPASSRPLQRLRIALDGHGYIFELEIQVTTPVGYLLNRWQTFKFHPLPWMRYEDHLSFSDDILFY